MASDETFQDLCRRCPDVKKNMSDKKLLEFIHDQLPGGEIDLDQLRASLYDTITNAILDGSIPRKVLEDTCNFVMEFDSSKGEFVGTLVAVDLIIVGIRERLVREDKLKCVKKLKENPRGTFIQMFYYQKK